MAGTVFVSGGAGGLGRAAVEHLAGRGWQVWAGDLPGERLDALSGRPGITPIAVDVTDTASVERAADALPERLDGVVTFAGILRVGSLAEIADAELARIVDVNLLGTARVVRAVFDRIVTARGRVVVISSETGWQTAAPFNGAYALTKHGVEAYADALRREAALVGVSVVKIQPGPFRTDMVGGIGPAFERAASTSRHFARILRRMGPVAAKESAKANDPALLAAVVAEALETPRPRSAYSVRPDRLRTALEWLPDRWADAVIGLGLRRWNR